MSDLVWELTEKLSKAEKRIAELSALVSSQGIEIMGHLDRIAVIENALKTAGYLQEQGNEN
jgi:hypothetical protein